MNGTDSYARLRVIQVVNVRWFNATAWYGLFLATLLREAGHEVRVLCPAGTECCDKAREMGLDPEPLDLNKIRAAGVLMPSKGRKSCFSPSPGYGICLATRPGRCGWSG